MEHHSTFRETAIVIVVLLLPRGLYRSVLDCCFLHPSFSCCRFFPAFLLSFSLSCVLLDGRCCVCHLGLPSTMGLFQSKSSRSSAADARSSYSSSYPAADGYSMLPPTDSLDESAAAVAANGRSSASTTTGRQRARPQSASPSVPSSSRSSLIATPATTASDSGRNRRTVADRHSRSERAGPPSFSSSVPSPFSPPDAAAEMSDEEFARRLQLEEARQAGFHSELEFRNALAEALDYGEPLRSPGMAAHAVHPHRTPSSLSVQHHSASQTAAATSATMAAAATAASPETDSEATRDDLEVCDLVDLLPSYVFDSSKHSVSQCMICCDDLSDGQLVRVLPCVHAFHGSCIDPYLRRYKFECPACKVPVLHGLGISVRGAPSHRSRDVYYSGRPASAARSSSSDVRAGAASAAAISPLFANMKFYVPKTAAATSPSPSTLTLSSSSATATTPPSS